MSSLQQLSRGPYGSRLLERFYQIRPQSVEEAKADPDFKKQLHRAESYFMARKAHYANAFDKQSPATDVTDREIKRNQQREAYIEEKIGKEIDNWVRNYPNCG